MLAPHSKGVVRDIARAIEQEVTDGLIDARGAGVTTVRIVSDGAKAKVVPVGPGASTAADQVSVATES
jgi:hypothetical protein